LIAFGLALASLIPATAALAGSPSPIHSDQQSWNSGNPACYVPGTGFHYGATWPSGTTCRSIGTPYTSQIRIHEWSHSWDSYYYGGGSSFPGLEDRPQCVVKRAGYSLAGPWTKYHNCYAGTSNAEVVTIGNVAI
jgi:hypothetical protein